MQPNSPLLFVSYTSADRDRVLPYVDYLEAKGYECWIDVRRLKAGQDWDREIKIALGKATIIILFISNNSIIRRGYVQRELKIALEKYEEKVFGDIYLIPVLLDDAEIPDQIRSIHCVKSWEVNSEAAIADAISSQLQTLGAQTQAVQDSSKIYWIRTHHNEMWDDLPGYEIELSAIDLRSTEYPSIKEASSYFKNLIMDEVARAREAKFTQYPDVFNFGQERRTRTHEFYAHCQDPVIVGKIITLQCTITYYHAMAVHPNLAFFTSTYLVDPLIRIRSLSEIFIDKNRALEICQSEVRRSMLENSLNEPGQVVLCSDWVKNGTSDWDCFRSFIFREKGIEVLFPPYQVDCYAAGPQCGFVKYQHIASLIHPYIVSALGASFRVDDGEATTNEK